MEDIIINWATAWNDARECPRIINETGRTDEAARRMRVLDECEKALHTLNNHTNIPYPLKRYFISLDSYNKIPAEYLFSSSGHPDGMSLEDCNKFRDIAIEYEHAQFGLMIYALDIDISNNQEEQEAINAYNELIYIEHNHDDEYKIYRAKEIINKYKEARYWIQLEKSLKNFD